MDGQVIDRSKLEGLRRELGVNFPRILSYFREDGVKSLRQIDDAVRTRDAVAMVRPAHTLKGEALQFGAMRLGLAAERIERGARDAVERHGFPSHVLGDAALLPALFEEALEVLERDAALATTVRRVVGFGRKAATGA